MRPAVLVVVAAAVMAAVPFSAGAGQPGFSITPMAGYRGGGGFEEPGTGRGLDIDGGVVGSLVLNLEQSTDRWYELIYSRQETELDGTDVDITIQYLHVGGMAAWPQQGFSTYLAAGIGATWLKAGGSGSGSDSGLSFSLGLGLLVPLSERVALRVEGRGYLTFTDGDSGFLCVSGSGGGVCGFSYDGDVLTQIDATAGLTFRF